MREIQEGVGGGGEEHWAWLAIEKEAIKIPRLVTTLVLKHIPHIRFTRAMWKGTWYEGLSPAIIEPMLQGALRASWVIGI